MQESPRLTSLRIENLALIREAEIDLHDGLNVLSGETGAGKTMLAKALEVLLGAKAPKQVVRPGAAAAYIEASFQLPPDWECDEQVSEILEDLGGELILARRIAAEGKSRCMVNGRTVSLEVLKNLARGLILFYGQHEGRNLMLEGVQSRLLDASGDGRGKQLHEAFLVCWGQAQRDLRELQVLQQAQEQDHRQLDLDRYELEELQTLNPQAGEEKSLHDELDLLSSSVEGSEACALADRLIDGAEHGVISQLGEAARVLDSAGGPGKDLASRIEACQEEIVDLHRDLQNLSEAWDADPARLSAVEARLGDFHRLARKHGVGLDELEGVLSELQDKVSAADQTPQRLIEAERAAAASLEKAKEAAAKLSAWRKKQAPRLATRVSNALQDLAMQGAVFSIDLQPGELGGAGGEQVQFMLQSNPGLPIEPLNKVASGGEISRLMLALLSESGEREQGIMILDEPDTGIGGHTAHGVADRLKTLSRHTQLLVISHLPQIAARADRMLQIEKATDGKDTVTEIRPLQNEEEIIDELCRMGGHDPADPDARKAAKKMLVG